MPKDRDLVLGHPEMFSMPTSYNFHTLRHDHWNNSAPEKVERKPEANAKAAPATNAKHEEKQDHVVFSAEEPIDKHHG